MTAHNVDLPKRKPTRLQGYDYSQNGAYFVTICTHNRQPILCNIVGDGLLHVPQYIIELSPAGHIVEETIQFLHSHSDHISIDKYVIMPNHVHMIVFVHEVDGTSSKGTCGSLSSNGTSRMPSPTNMTIPKFISSLKRYTNKRCGEEIWQRSYYDHIIRGEDDYRKIWQYIDDNPRKWQEDDLYV
jgi:REP element-mobilizing transposase RayT